MQTLNDSDAIEDLIAKEQQSEDDVQTAREKGLLCPALFELVCEALESSGRGPERMHACQTLDAVEACSSTCRRSSR